AGFAGGVSDTPGGNKVGSLGSGVSTTGTGPQSGSAGTDTECKARKALMHTSGSSWLMRITCAPGVEPAVVMGTQVTVVPCAIAKNGSACMNGSAFMRASAVCAVLQASGVM